MKLTSLLLHTSCPEVQTYASTNALSLAGLFVLSNHYLEAATEITWYSLSLLLFRAPNVKLMLFYLVIQIRRSTVSWINRLYRLVFINRHFNIVTCNIGLLITEYFSYALEIVKQWSFLWCCVTYEPNARHKRHTCP